MADKALIYSLTHRSLESQREAFSGMSVFVGPEEIPAMLRQTSRPTKDTVHVVSLGIIADNELDFVEFVTLVKARGAVVVSKEQKRSYEAKLDKRQWLISWQNARRTGAPSIGGTISANNRKAKCAAGIAKIKDRWPMSSKIWSTKQLLKEAGVSLNAVKAALGRRPLEQANYRAKMKRKMNAK